MRYYIDAEFNESPGRVGLISIGLACEDGREFYAVSSEFVEADCNDWVRANVLPLLGDTPRQTRAQIRDGILAFIGDDKPEIWGYYCVAPETRVLTADLRWVAIGTLRPGDRLAGFDENPIPGNGRSSRWRCWRTAVVESSETVERPCYDLTFEDGTRVRCSADHRWLTSNGYEGAEWKTTAGLRPGVTKVVKPIDPWETETSRAAGYLAAAFDGEGHLTQTDLEEKGHRGRFRFRVGFSQKNNPMLAEVRQMLLDAGYNPISGGNKKTNVHFLNIARREQAMRFLGSIRPVRLLPAFDVDRCGAMALRGMRLATKAECGPRDVVSIKTTTGTFIAEGLASHNCAYDWVAFCQVFGAMVDLPPNFPMYILDIRQVMHERGIRKSDLPPKPKDAHSAIADAKWHRAMHEAILARGSD